MATLYYKIFRHHQKADGKFNIKVCLTHKGKQVYHSTTHHADSKQLKRDMTIKDNALLRDVLSDVDRMERRLSALGSAIEPMTAKEVLTAIAADPVTESPDFVRFCIDHIQSLKDGGRDGYYRALRSTVNSIIDHFGPSYPATGITSAKLKEFQRYVSGPRSIDRQNQFGEKTNTRIEGASTNGVYWIMNGFRVLFNACRARYNTEYSVPIPNQPFSYYKMPRKIKVRKRGEDLGATDVAAIRDADASGIRAIGRDIFMLSFYMCGLNAKDIWDSDWVISGGRLEYNRSKTRGRRKDEAFISVRVPDEAAELIDRYCTGMLRRRYKSYDTFITAVNDGLGAVSDQLGLPPISFYHARHTFATMARNICGFTKEEVAKALNHVDSAYAVTEEYLADDWSIVDRIQEGVMGLLPANDPV